ncbi:MAG: glycosyltransferase family 2 protein [Saprospiraceae bacterium]|nr:glycosyltransferase family 2 protein [Saprospiraceae bacterium]
MNTPISVVIIANNASLRIGEVIGAARRISDDIIVLDSGSEDETVEIASDLGARIVHQSWLGYSATKNVGNGLAYHNLILSIDSDEVLSEQLIESIQKEVFDNNTIYLLDRANYYCGKWIRFCHWNPDWIPRLFDRNKAHWKGEYVHEKLNFHPSMTIKKLKGKLIHYSYESLSQRLKKVKNYALLSAQDRFRKGKRTNWLFILLSPFFKFLITYFIHLGILDGWRGIHIAWTDAVGTWHKNRILYDLQRNLNPSCCN